MSFPKNMNAPKFDKSNNEIIEVNNNIDYNSIGQAFIPYENRIILKRDETTTNHPCPDDLVVGELVLNAITGNLYTKLVSGQIVYFPGKAVCLTGSTVSNNYTFTLEAPSNYSEDTYTLSKYGVTISTKTGYALNFNPILSPSAGLPQSYNILYSPSKDDPFTVVGRISAVSDYYDTGFEFVYTINDKSIPFPAKFKEGTYPNGSFGHIKVEII